MHFPEQFAIEQEQLEDELADLPKAEWPEIDCAYVCPGFTCSSPTPNGG
jgi:hypothetical protein